MIDNWHAVDVSAQYQRCGSSRVHETRQWRQLDQQCSMHTSVRSLASALPLWPGSTARRWSCTLVTFSGTMSTTTLYHSGLCSTLYSSFTNWEYQSVLRPEPHSYVVACLVAFNTVDDMMHLYQVSYSRHLLAVLNHHAHRHDTMADLYRYYRLLRCTGYMHYGRACTSAWLLKSSIDTGNITKCAQCTTILATGIHLCMAEVHRA